MRRIALISLIIILFVGQSGCLDSGYDFKTVNIEYRISGFMRLGNETYINRSIIKDKLNGVSEDIEVHTFINSSTILITMNTLFENSSLYFYLNGASLNSTLLLNKKYSFSSRLSSDSARILDEEYSNDAFIVLSIMTTEICMKLGFTVDINSVSYRTTKMSI